ncbi:HAD-IIB family hydrolase [Oceanobacillus piezotolerans]|uniref:HAD-IIB family hydrolase n=2 Tax=Oceanobacillus piezotolerans TaxID=2448030 RepID=A0A498D8J3_9BACI|nr:HAD-IIB family hydrolase [Oceanobacillus piezotolerans]
MLATDLDGTLVGDVIALKELLQFFESQPYNVELVYITGRHYDSALSLIDSESLPLPSILVTDVGTSIYSGSELLPDSKWEKKMMENWNPQAIKEIAMQIPGISLQSLPDDRRVSFYVNDNKEASMLRQKLKESDLSHTFVFSSGRDVDVLPEGAGKGKALQYIVKEYADDQANILVAGDSGNDLDMLTLGYPAVIVGNAQKELLEVNRENIYNATKACAGGIQQAWKHYYG